MTVTGVSEADLLRAMKKVHEHRGTTEYSWLLEELPILEPYLQGKKAKDVLDSALYAQNSARKHNTKLFPGVASTLQYIKSCGVKVVAYTESLSFWTEWRLRLTGLDGVIDVLYSSPDHDFPEGETVETVRTLPDEEYELKQTIHKSVPRGISKPSAEILQTIIREHAVDGMSVVYVGDKLDRDVAMAQSVPGVIDVHAVYGDASVRPEYDLLRTVTHWTDADVERERAKGGSKPRATYVLDEGFYQLLALFDFRHPFDVTANLELWKESVGVQMHFNDIGWRIRALALTVLTFTLGALGFAYVNTTSITIAGWSVSPAVAVPFIGVGLWIAVWFADRGWFHKLLYGAVREGTRLEKALTANGVEAHLGGYIGEESPIRFYRYQSKKDRRAGLPKAQRMFRGKGLQWHSGTKLNLFYWIGIVLLVVPVVGIIVLGPRVEAVDPPAEPVIVNNYISIETPTPATTAPTP